jgi:hypothetical protein
MKICLIITTVSAQKLQCQHIIFILSAQYYISAHVHPAYCKVSFLVISVSLILSYDLETSPTFF